MSLWGTSSWSCDPDGNCFCSRPDPQEGPADYRCEERYGGSAQQEELCECLDMQDHDNVVLRLDNGDVWKWRILPGVAGGLALGLAIGFFAFRR